MKALRLSISHIGIIEDAVIAIDKPLVIFYGEVMQGKSTILNSLKWVMGGSFPDDIIRHGEDEAFIQFEASEDGKPLVIRREWYRGRDGTTKARSIAMTRNGVPVKKPDGEIAKFLNPFLLDQDHLRRMNDLQRQRYLVELFAVDTTSEDVAIADLAQQASELRIRVKSYGTIDLTPVETVDVDALRKQLDAIRFEHSKGICAVRRELAGVMEQYEGQLASIEVQNEEIRQHNQQVAFEESGVVQANAEDARICGEIEKLHQRLTELRRKKADRELWLKGNPRQSELPKPAKPDTSALHARIDARCDTAELEGQIMAAGAQNVRAEQYQRNLARSKARAADEKQVLDLERKQRELKEAKVAKLAALSGKCGVPGMTFSEDGSFRFEGVSAGMLSDSQIMRLSQLLSNLYPKGFGLSLIDRGESLGKSVLKLWEEAQQQERSILVTVVGDKPAKIPEQVGAFVVEGGKVKSETLFQ